MSTLKADAVTTKSDNTDLTITGGGTGVPNLEAGFKVGGTVGVPISGLQVGTDGELITWDASGDPAAVAVGTATHVLTSNGAGAAPTFQAAGGGAWTVISSTTISSPTTNIDFTGLTSTYKMYALVGTSLHGDSDGADLKMRVGTGAGPTYDTGGSSYAYHLGAIRAGDAAYAAIASAAASGFQIHSGLDALATAPSNFIVYVMDPSNATLE